MQLIRILRLVLKNFIYKFTALSFSYGGAYLISVIIGESEAFTKMGLFGLFFLAIYFLLFSLSWALIYIVFDKMIGVRGSMIKILVLWVLFYGTVFSVWPNGEPTDQAYFTLGDWINRVGVNVLKTLPALVLLLLFIRKDFLKPADSTWNSDSTSIIDKDLAQPSNKNP